MQRGFKALPIEERFSRHVDASGGPGACWLWTGTKNAVGYGLFIYGPVWDRKRCGAHRMAYRLAGKMDGHDGIVHLAHSCGNRLCCNPDHLSLKSRKHEVKSHVDDLPVSVTQSACT